MRRGGVLTNNVVDASAPSFRKWLGLSEAVALAAITLAGYVYTFAYDAGYLSHFGVPASFIEVSLASALNTFGHLVLVIAVLGLLAMFLPAGPWWALLFQLSMLAIPLGWTLFVAKSTDWHSWQSVFVGFLLAVVPGLYATRRIVTGVIAPVFIYKDQPSLPERWAIRFRKERNANTANPDLLAHSITALHEIGIRRVWLLGFCLVFVAGEAAARQLGLTAAYFQTRYTVVPGPRDCVMVGKYGDYILCSEIDRKTLTVLPEFRLLRTGDQQATVARVEYLGRLAAPTPIGAANNQ